MYVFYVASQQGEDPESDALVYRILRGNEEDHFTINSNRYLRVYSSAIFLYARLYS